MAILRGGRRIGPFDIRLGIPRDKSLNDVQGDKRLGRTMGPNPESTIGRMLATVAEGEGFARPTRFMVDFILPKGVKTEFVSLGLKQETERSTLIGQLTEGNKIQRGLRAYVDSVDMPGRNLDTVDLKIYGPKRQIVNGHSFSGEITMSVYCDKYLRQRAFFESWQTQIFSEDSHNMNYYDDYVGHMDIYQLGASGGEGDRDRITYAVRLEEVYPETIGSIDYDYGANYTFVNVPISLRYRKWRNLTIDDINLASIGKGQGDVPTIKKGQDFGLFGGLLSKLPPELQRAGKQIIDAGRRNLPIGKVTGGRVQPPFPPLT